MLEIGKNSSNIHWVTKSRGYLRSGGDIQVNVGKYTASGKVKKQANIIVRNNQHKKFQSGYVTFGIAGSRLYIVDSDVDNGYKLSVGTTSYARYVKVTDDTLTDWCNNHRGSYDLNFDDSNNMYYIETMKEEN